MPYTMVIADDHCAIWDAVVSWLSKEGDYEVVAQASDGITALQACISHKPNILLLDMSMPGLSGLQVIGALRKTSFPTKIVVYTADDSPEMATECIIDGAVGYVIKSSPRQVLLQAVQTVLQNEIYIDPLIRDKVTTYLKQEENPHPALTSKKTVVLTEREAEVMQLLVLGSGKSADIATILSVSRNTVNNHISSIFRKLEVSTRTEAIREARRIGIIQT